MLENVAGMASQKGLKWEVISELCDEVGTQFHQFHQTYILLDGI